MSKSFLRISFLWIFVSTIFVCYAASEEMCPHNCHDRGLCITKTKECQCAHSYIEEDYPYCDGTPYNTGNSLLYFVVRVSIGSLYGIVCVTSITILYVVNKKERTKSLDTRKNLLAGKQKLLAKMIMVSSLGGVITWSLDPFGYSKILPFVIAKLMDTGQMIFIVLSFLVMISYWAETSYLSLAKKEDSNSGTLSALQTLRGLHTPSLIAIGLTTSALQIGGEISNGLLLSKEVLNMWWIWITITVVAATIVFFMFRRRVIPVLRDKEDVKQYFQRIDRRFLLVSINFLLITIIGWVMSQFFSAKIFYFLVMILILNIQTVLNYLVLLSAVANPSLRPPFLDVAMPPYDLLSPSTSTSSVIREMDGLSLSTTSDYNRSNVSL